MVAINRPSRERPILRGPRLEHDASTAFMDAYTNGVVSLGLRRQRWRLGFFGLFTDCIAAHTTNVRRAADRLRCEAGLPECALEIEIASAGPQTSPDTRSAPPPQIELKGWIGDASAETCRDAPR